MIKRRIDIEDLLIWTYQTQRADRVIRAEEAALPKGPAGWAEASVLDGLGQTGVSIRSASGDRVPQSLHSDAETVHEAVSMLPSRMGALIILSARAGERPDWTAGRLRMEPQWRELASGGRKPVVIYDRNRNPVLCPVEPRPTAEEYRAARETWALWHEGLVRLVALLTQWPGCLQLFEIRGPTAPASPWARRRDDLGQMQKGA
ncbi:hypothetical protein P7L68_19585 [Tistrella mobilis]|uniref:hypothetical protein n=1 Tax=Tistrella mobilis TaxID=171437 RepID=UPI003556FA61